MFGSPTSLLYRADLVRRTKTFYPNSSPHCDTTACYQSLEDSDFGFVHQVLSYTRVHPESQTSRSLKFGIVRLEALGDFCRFGPKYLSPAEMKQRLNALTDWYYDALPRVLLEQSGNKEFWQQQKVALQELGLQFSFAKLLRTVLAKGFSRLLKPRAAVKRLLEAKRGAHKIEAQYYDC